ncbi:chitinase-like protein Idgf4 [Anopheles aquasalis]|uniref:chitinase-like protein Idgf4 n=1 Tax=Anopheles aquasalis TaxID=42839 RepID=UPI00215A3153|nr:chitinase-like protein Idgf4 [Anopheles aquasalis]
MMVVLNISSLVLVLVALGGIVHGKSVANDAKVLCFYDGEAALKDDPLTGKVTLVDIEVALPYCTHLVYGYAAIDAKTYQLKPLNEALDLDTGRGQYRAATTLKSRFPGLKVYLSVGDYYDLTEEDNSEKYLALLESDDSITAFVNSARTLLKEYGFDGLDLAWQFPQPAPTQTTDHILESKGYAHRDGFTKLIRELGEAFGADGLDLGYTIPPHVNESFFLDIEQLNEWLVYVNINAFDQNNQRRNPEEADYTAPIYEGPGRAPGNNIDAKVKLWSSAGTQLDKIIVGIPTFGRGWKLVKESGTTGVPPVRADGPSSIKSLSTYAGYYSFTEVCAILTDTNHGSMNKVHDPRFGPYAFRVADETEENGIWLSYEDTESASNKARYVKETGLGGIAVNDLADDDYLGRCTGEKFSITRAVRQNL